MKISKLILAILLITVALPLKAQQRNISLTISVTANTGESLSGLAVSLTQTDYSLSYGTVTLDSTAKATLKVYSGNHRLTVTKNGYETVTKDFAVNNDTTVSVELVESQQLPFSLKPTVDHNVFTGKNDVTLSWNKEEPTFFDDFESYDAFSIKFGEWTGIDGDNEAAAPLVGSYLNRGVLQYAQIINPMTVEPTWWYDYPVLRPYSGKQYVGFTRTQSGNANDDWLISPTITVGQLNKLSFMAKAADAYKEKFQVYVTEKTDNPQVSDFTLISSGNYESVDYKAWKEFTYDLASYAGKPIKFAIHYISEANNGGAFMLMVDDVYVGQIYDSSTQKSSRLRVAKRIAKSPMDPNESFALYLNDVKQGTTEDYEYTFKDLSAGTYKLGVKAVYKAGETAIVDTTITITDKDLAALNFNVATNNSVSSDGFNVDVVNEVSSKSSAATVASGKASFPSLPYGDYLVSISGKNFVSYSAKLHFSADTTINVTLNEKLIAPYNITAQVTTAKTNDNTVLFKWNQNLTFNDSFEDYADFAQGSFGKWKSIDLDKHNVYPIGLGSATNIVTFPGASTTTTPTAIAPIVFNPLKTTPAMAPTDKAVVAPTGDKTIAFFSPQQNGANKWLISQQFQIREGDVWRLTAKAYTTYAESMEFCVSTTDDSPSSFKAIGTVSNLPYSAWTRYEIDLKDYYDKKVYLAVHYTTYDGFFSQIDDFFVGNPNGNDSTVDVGAVNHYEISLDGTSIGTSTTPSFTTTGVKDGAHTVAVKAVYSSGTTEPTSYNFTIDASGIEVVKLNSDDGVKTYYNLAGQQVAADKLSQGIYIEMCNGKSKKVVIR
jgi:hypothetical protein